MSGASQKSKNVAQVSSCLPMSASLKTIPTKTQHGVNRRKPARLTILIVWRVISSSFPAYSPRRKGSRPSQSMMPTGTVNKDNTQDRPPTASHVHTLSNS
jgi:hypothetical protein